MSRYNVVVDPDAPNNSHAYALQLVGFNQRVLEFGCADGHVTKALVARGCEVVGVERDPESAQNASEYAEDVLVADLDTDDIFPKLEGRKFDVALFGDILEHLRDPLAVLRRARHLLSPGGFVVLSVPNIAHVDVRIALLRGKFDYREVGLLDETHLRFFTRSSIERTLEHAGLVPVELKRVRIPPFATELEVEEQDIDGELLQEILEDPEAETFQFVMKVVPRDALAAAASLAPQLLEAQDELDEDRVTHALELARMTERAEAAEAEAEAASTELAQVRQALDAIYRTRLFRWTRLPRGIYQFFREMT